MAMKEEEVSDADKQACVQKVREHFPDICLDFLHSISGPLAYNAEQVIDHVLERQDSGESYPATKTEVLRTVFAEVKEEQIREWSQEYADPNREKEIVRGTWSYNTTKEMIAGDFPRVPMKSIDDALFNNKNHLYPAYMELLMVYANHMDHDKPLPWKEKKYPSPMNSIYAMDQLHINIPLTRVPNRQRLMRELLTARITKWQNPRTRTLDTRLREALNFQQAVESGQVYECECCFTDCPLNRLIRCDGEQPHLFCPRCCEKNAETQIGLNKFELRCMSTEGCSAGFSVSERAKFLSADLAKGLDRIEKEVVLRIAGIENLAKCPFCPYAEIYPLVDIVQVFRCQGPDCGKMSCRLCNSENHHPMSCEEAARQRLDFRHTVEEAMSRAMIRKCNKCGIPFIKENGCNKMTCPQPTCRNVQCYVCSENCDYKHFKSWNNCKLFDSVEDRHRVEAEKAGKVTTDALLAANPHLNAQYLAVNMSANVEKDDLERKQKDPYVNQDLLYIDGLRVNGQVQADRDRERYREQQDQRWEQVLLRLRAEAIDRLQRLHPDVERQQLERIMDNQIFNDLLEARQPQAQQNGGVVPEGAQDIPAAPNVGNHPQVNYQVIQQQIPVAQNNQQQQPDQGNLFQGPLQGQANVLQPHGPTNNNSMNLYRPQNHAMGNTNGQLINHREAHQATPTRQNQQRSQGFPPQAVQGQGPQTGTQIQGQQPARTTLQRIRQRRADMDMASSHTQARQRVAGDRARLVAGRLADLALNDGQGQDNHLGQIGDSPNRRVIPTQTGLQQQPTAQVTPQFDPNQFNASSGMGQQAPRALDTNNQFGAAFSNHVRTGQAPGQFGGPLNMGQQVPQVQLNQFGQGQTRNRAYTGLQQIPHVQPNQGQNRALQLNQFGGVQGRNRALSGPNLQQQVPGVQGQNGAPQTSRFGTGAAQNHFGMGLNMGPQTLWTPLNHIQNGTGQGNLFGMAQTQNQSDTGLNLQQQAPRFQPSQGQNEAGENPNPFNPFGPGFNMGQSPQ